MSIKVHPGIGVARIGNSPEYFIGPEVPNAAAPAGGFRDAECRIKRQAALFRVFEHLPDGSASEIIASPTTTITWTVNLSKTLTFAGTGTAISGPGLILPVPAFGTGFLPGAMLGELHTDDQGRLLICSGNVPISESSIFDGRAEGYVQASVVRDGVALGSVASSWVVIYQPDFAPALDPASGGVAGALLALWPDASPTSPALPYTEQLDRGPLTFVGGWDALTTPPLSDFEEPFRFFETGPSSSLRHPGYTNWAADLYGMPSDSFSGCNSSGWASEVGIDAASATPTGLKGANWRLRGFLAEQPDASLKYVDWCPEIVVPAQVNFYQVPRGTERAVPIHLELTNFPEATAVTANVLGQPAVHVAPATTPVVPENHTVPMIVWAFFQAAPDADLGPEVGTIELHFGPHHSVSIPLHAVVVNEERSAVSLVLDCSGSMALSRGDRLSRLDGLKSAVNVFLDVAQPGSGVAIAPFSTRALPARSAQVLGNGGMADEGPGGARRGVRDFVGALATDDLTAIGAGILSGQSLLEAESVADFERKALIVVTDGYQTSSPYVAEVIDSVSANTYAIGIGPAFEPTLRDIVASTDGFVSIMSDPVAPGNRYTLEKYFLQMLAGVTAGDIVVDPEGELSTGEVHRIPFSVSEAERRIDITVVSDFAPGLVVAVEGPNGTVRTFEQIQALGQARVTQSRRVEHAELRQPFDPGEGGELWGPGRWAILIAYPEREFPKGQSPFSASFGSNPSHVRLPEGLQGRSASYLAMATTASALRMNPSMQRVPDGILLEASLGYAGAPILRGPDLFVELTTPSRSVSAVPLAEVAPGRFQAHVPSGKLGRYRAIFRARGTSPQGNPFQRERAIEEFFAQERPRPSVSDCRDCCRQYWPCKLPGQLFRLEEKIHRAFKKLGRRCRW